ncbi:hypothetical protein ACFL6N_00220 [Thermodesulfobacteriota bacterium]
MNTSSVTIRLVPLVRAFLLILLLLLVTGCSRSMMTRSDTIVQPDAGYALVTFVRQSSFGQMIKPVIWDRDKFVGILAARSYIQYKCPPGKHLFLAQAKNWAYITADLSAGKHYFIIAKAMPRIWEGRVALAPVKPDSASHLTTDKWLQGLSAARVIPEKVNRYEKKHRFDVRRAIEQFEVGEVEFSILESTDGI